MEKNINKILEDIYMADETLRPHEEELKKVVEKLIASKPQADIDERFLSELRSEILKRADEIKTGEKEGVSTVRQSVFGKLAYALGGAALVLVLVIPFLNKGQIMSELKVADDSVMSSVNEVRISKLANNAFGFLGQANNGDPDMAVMERSQSGGGGVPAPINTANDATLGLGGGGGMSESAKMIAPEYTEYEFVYTGDELMSPADELEVYRKVKNSMAQNDLAQKVAQMNIGALDLSKFKNTNVTNLNIVEDREFGYSLYFNLADNHIMIGSNWEKWPRPDENCREQACFDRYRLKISDVPSDNELIAIADRFLDEYNIDIKNYGEGEVLDHWRRSYEQAEDKTMAWIPEIIQVVYPLKINGEVVYDESGNKVGAMVEVNIRHKKASGLNNVIAQVYESSLYDAETDTGVIKKIAENGGRYNRYYYGSSENSRRVTLELGTPTIGLVQYWHYDDSKGGGNELYVPSYIFPIVNKPVGVDYYQKTVVVPLVKDLLKEYEEIPGRPMPLIEPRVMIEEPAIEPEAIETKKLDE